MALVFVMTAGGCIAAARKSIGTIVGPKGKMELIECNGGIEPSEQVQSVFIVNKLGVQIKAKDISVLQSSIESQLAAAGLFGGGAAVTQGLVSGIAVATHIGRAGVGWVAVPRTDLVKT